MLTRTLYQAAASGVASGLERGPWRGPWTHPEFTECLVIRPTISAGRDDTSYLGCIACNHSRRLRDSRPDATPRLFV